MIQQRKRKISDFMKHEIVCENVCCLYEVDGCCREESIVIDQRGVCASCFLLPVMDKKELKEKKNMIEWAEPVYHADKPKKE